MILLSIHSCLCNRACSQVSHPICKDVAKNADLAGESILENHSGMIAIQHIQIIVSKYLMWVKRVIHIIFSHRPCIRVSIQFYCSQRFHFHQKSEQLLPALIRLNQNNEPHYTYPLPNHHVVFPHLLFPHW